MSRFTDAGLVEDLHLVGDYLLHLVWAVTIQTLHMVGLFATLLTQVKREKWLVKRYCTLNVFIVLQLTLFICTKSETD